MKKNLTTITAIKNVSGALGAILSLASNVLYLRYVTTVIYDQDSVLNAVALYIFLGSVFFWIAYIVACAIQKSR